MTETTAMSRTTQDLLGAVDRIGPLIAKHAAEAEMNRQLSRAVYDGMRRAGLFAILAPKTRGGLELHPVECVRVWEAIVRFDSAAAWNLAMNQAVTGFAAWLPAAGVDELFYDGPPTVAGALHPPPPQSEQMAAGGLPDRSRLQAVAITPTRWGRSRWCATRALLEAGARASGQASAVINVSSVTPLTALVRRSPTPRVRRRSTASPCRWLGRWRH
jgi:Acyl-CoA dehydrogenase, N-terminal domain